MAKNKITRILLADDKEITKTSGIKGALSRLFRKILLQLDIMPPKFGQLLHEYIMDSRHHVPNNKRDQTSMRGNLTKEFARTEMTWKVFCKALRFLQIVQIELAVKAKHRNGRITLHSIDIEFGDRRSMKDIDEWLDQEEDDDEEPDTSNAAMDELIPPFQLPYDEIGNKQELKPIQEGSGQMRLF